MDRTNIIGTANILHFAVSSGFAVDFFYSQLVYRPAITYKQTGSDNAHGPFYLLTNDIISNCGQESYFIT